MKINGEIMSAWCQLSGHKTMICSSSKKEGTHLDNGTGHVKHWITSINNMRIRSRLTTFPVDRVAVSCRCMAQCYVARYWEKLDSKVV
jgi:hypothetical protein